MIGSASALILKIKQEGGQLHPMSAQTTCGPGAGTWDGLSAWKVERKREPPCYREKPARSEEARGAFVSQPQARSCALLGPGPGSEASVPRGQGPYLFCSAQICLALSKY